MAKQTGQITVLKNNTVVNVEHQIRFIFMKNSGERITRDTNEKGVINFDIPDGDWNVSWFAVTGDQKVLPLRAGLQLKITSSTPETALADWIYGDNTHVADPILAQWTAVLDEMKAVRDEFRDETSFVGEGKIMREGASGISVATLISKDSDLNNYTDFGFYAITANTVASTIENMPALIKVKSNLKITKSSVTTKDCVQWLTHFRSGLTAVRTYYAYDNVWSDWEYIYTTRNTKIGNHGQLHDGTGTPKDLLAAGDYGVGVTAPLNGSLFEKKLTGFYSDMDNVANSIYPSKNHMQAIAIAHPAGSYTVGIMQPLNSLEAYTFNQSGKYAKILTDANNIIDSNGNWKPASPVVQLHHDRAEYNEGFDKDNPPVFEHLEIGVYKLSNVREICKDGWTFNKPIDGKGQHYFMIKWEQVDETTLIVRVFERVWNDDLKDWDFGEPKNIGENERWVDLHFEVDHERIALEEAQMQKEQEEYEEQERLRKEAEEKAEKEAQEAWEAEMKRQEAEMLAEMEAEHKEE